MSTSAARPEACATRTGTPRDGTGSRPPIRLSGRATALAESRNVSAEFVDRLREAADAYIAGNVEPFVGLLDSDVEWIGRTRGYLWWRSTPS